MTATLRPVGCSGDMIRGGHKQCQRVLKTCRTQQRSLGVWNEAPTVLLSICASKNPCQEKVITLIRVCEPVLRRASLQTLQALRPHVSAAGAMQVLQMWLSVPKTIFTKTGSGPDLAHEP
jgi:hypothetical protein